MVQRDGAYNDDEAVLVRERVVLRAGVVRLRGPGAIVDCDEHGRRGRELVWLVDKPVAFASASGRRAHATGGQTDICTFVGFVPKLVTSVRLAACVALAHASAAAMKDVKRIVVEEACSFRLAALDIYSWHPRLYGHGQVSRAGPGRLRGW